MSLDRALAHELIHALHLTEGGGTYDTTEVTYRFQTGTNRQGEVLLNQHVTNREELNTVGLRVIAGSDGKYYVDTTVYPGDITENAIAQENAWVIRGAYNMGKPVSNK
jgi:hypothetical protein